MLFLAMTVVYLKEGMFFKPGLQVGMDSYMNDISFLQKKDGKIKWQLKAKRAVFLDDHSPTTDSRQQHSETSFGDKDVKLSDLKMTFPEKNLVLISDQGMYDIESRNLMIKGNIKASAPDYDILATTLFWDSSKEEIFSKERVRIVGRNFVVEGDGLTATTDKARLNYNVKAVFHGK